MPTPPPNKAEVARMQRRQKIVEEILQTERTHCAGLGYLIEHCLKPLRQADIIPAETIDSIFLNVEEVYVYSSQLISIIAPEIESWSEENSRLARVFVDFCEPMLTAYGKYMENHERALQELDKQIKKKSKLEQFLKDFKEQPESNAWTLEMYLITPVQRLLRYSLLFKDYRAHTRDDSDEAQAAQELLAALERCAAAVNDTVKRKQNALQLQKIRDSFASLPKDVSEILLGDHLFIREGSLTKICRKTNMRRYFWLFSDCMLYGATAAQGYVFHRYIPLTKLKVKSVADTDEVTNAFQIISAEKSFTVMADTKCEKEFWLMDITECLGKGRQRNLDEEFYTGGGSTEADAGEAPVWVPDKLAPMCMICGTSFSVIKRRHHCRNCGKVVCGSCSSQKRVIPGLDLSKPERVCKFCYDLLEIQLAEKSSQETGKKVFPNLLVNESRTSSSNHWESVPDDDPSKEPKKLPHGVSSPMIQPKQPTQSVKSPHGRFSMSNLPLPSRNSPSGSSSLSSSVGSDCSSQNDKLCASSPPSSPSAVPDSVEVLREKLARCEKEIAQLRQRCAALEQENAHLRQQQQQQSRLSNQQLQPKPTTPGRPPPTSPPTAARIPGQPPQRQMSTPVLPRPHGPPPRPQPAQSSLPSAPTGPPPRPGRQSFHQP